ncbi:MAG: hypothetical protein R6W76_13070 [Caldilinea sp.]
MAQVIIENPVLNSPYVEPKQHFCFDDHGITDEIVAGRRRSSYFVPIARPRKKGAQPSLYVSTAATLWAPAVNNHGGFGRWAFLEITDPWNAQNLVHAYLLEHMAGAKRE